MKSFLTACGLANSLQLVIETADAGGGELRLLQQPFAIFGRDRRADIVLDHGRVEPTHVYLQVVDGRAFGSTSTADRGLVWPERRKSLAGWTLKIRWGSDRS